MNTPPSPPSLLKDPLFRRLWTTVELSFLGGFVHVVASAWLIALMSDNATLVALTQGAFALPMVVFSILAGALADTCDQRKTMVWALAFSIVASALLAVAAAFGLLEPWSMLALLFAVGTGVAIFTPSWQASLGSIVERDRLGEAVSLHNMGANVMRTVGPALGGFLVTFASATITFLVGAVSYLPALVALILWKPQPVTATVRESVTSAMGAGIRFLAASPQIQPIFLRGFCFSAAAISVMALLPLIARDQFGGDATDYGILFGAFGFGAILGGFAQRHLRQRHDSEWMVRRAFLINAAAMAVLAATHSFAVGLLATAIAGSCWLISHSIQNTTLQLATPRWMVGRMVSMFLTAAFLGISAGSWLWGAVAQRTGTEIALAISALAMAATWLLALRFPLPETNNLILEPLEQKDAIAAPVAQIEPRTGPVQVMVEHRVAEGRLSDFQRMMGLRRRHLIRLGARHWTLLGELGNEGAWVETFQFPTWADYQRLIQRRTAETVSLREEIRSLQCDGAEPVMRRFVIRSNGPQQNTVMLRT